MAGKTRPSLRAKTLQNVATSNLSTTDKKCIFEVFNKFAEVVKCGECKHKDECLQYVDCEFQNREIDFCSYGERIDN